MKSPYILMQDLHIGEDCVSFNALNNLKFEKYNNVKPYLHISVVQYHNIIPLSKSYQALLTLKQQSLATHFCLIVINSYCYDYLYAEFTSLDENISFGSTQ